MDAEERERRVQDLVEELGMSREHAEFIVSLDRSVPDTAAIARERRAAERRIGNDRRGMYVDALNQGAAAAFAAANERRAAERRAGDDRRLGDPPQ